jgi:hypothetical protein
VGVVDNDAVTTSLADMQSEAFWNLIRSDDTYLIQSGRTPLRDFNEPDTLMKAHPLLFPYGRGGFVEVGEGGMKFIDRARWSLQYGDKRFRRHRSFLFEVFAIEQKRQVCQGASAQLRRQDFAQTAQLLQTITKRDIEQASLEEARGLSPSNRSIQKLRRLLSAGATHVLGSDRNRIDQREKIWGLTVRKSGAYRAENKRPALT